MDIELFERALARVMEDRKPGSLDETALRAVMDAKYPGSAETLL